MFLIASNYQMHICSESLIASIS